jgi:hypothetical protein
MGLSADLAVPSTGPEDDEPGSGGDDGQFPRVGA